jgi:hypothetical protein
MQKVLSLLLWLLVVRLLQNIVVPHPRVSIAKLVIESSRTMYTVLLKLPFEVLTIG